MRAQDENPGQITPERENFILIALIKSKSCKLIIRFVEDNGCDYFKFQCMRTMVTSR